MSRSQLKRDIEDAEKNRQNFQNEICGLSSVKLDNDALIVELSMPPTTNNNNNNSGHKKVSFTLYPPDTYPKGEWNFIDENSEMDIFLNKSLGELLNLLLERYQRRNKSTAVTSIKTEPSDTEEEEDDDNEFSSQDVDEDHLLYEDDHFGAIEKPDESATLFNIDEEEAKKITAECREDIKKLEAFGFWGGLYPDPITHELLVRLALPLNFLGNYQAEAWSITPGVPIVIELAFSWKYTQDRKSPPKLLKVTQSTDKNLSKKDLKHSKECAVSWFLFNRISDILRRNWVKYFRNFDEVSEIILKQSSELKKIPDDIQALYQCGYGERLAKIALGHYPNVEEAKEKLANHDERMKFEAEAESFKVAEAYSDPLYTGLPGNSYYRVQDLENFFVYQNNAPTVTSITNTPPSPQAKGEIQVNVQKVEKKNFLVKLLEYAVIRLKTSGGSCVICDAPLAYTGLKLSPCPKPLCNHSFDSYGLGFSLESQLLHHHTVVDLLIAVTVAAAKNKRSNGADVFEPFPSSVQVEVKRKVKNPTVLSEKEEMVVLSFVNGKKKLLDDLVEVCEALPSVSEMKKEEKNPKKLKALLDERHPLCYPLLRWILMSNLCHIAPLKPDQYIKEMNTPWQFVLVSSTPEREYTFRKRKEELAKKYGKGSFYAFHGSALGNWHCIFRQGLKNYSGTERMSSGQAYGQGIYLATHASVSFHYMVGGNTWSKCGISGGGTLSCIALCEVLNLKKEKKSPIRDHGSILTCTDATAVNTRFVFLYPNFVPNPTVGQNVIADKLKLPKNVF